MTAKSLEKVLPIVGAILLLLSWAIQQFLYGEWNAALSRIGSSESTFQSYRAANELFKSLVVIAPEANKASIRQQQYDSYRKGLQEIGKTLDSDRYDLYRTAAIGTLPEEKKTFEAFDTDAKILLESEAMHRAISEKRRELSSKKAKAECLFRLFYLLGTLIVIGGGVAKLIASRNDAAK